MTVCSLQEFYCFGGTAIVGVEQLTTDTAGFFIIDSVSSYVTNFKDNYNLKHFALHSAHCCDTVHTGTAAIFLKLKKINKMKRNSCTGLQGNSGHAQKRSVFTVVRKTAKSD
jgi:hypothetical protein